MRMKNTRNICSILAALSLLLVSGCQKKAAMTTTVGEEGRATTDSLRFDPLELVEDRTIVPEEYPVSADVSGRETIIVDDSELGTDRSSPEELPDEVVDEVDSVTSQSFQVQIFTSELYGEAKHARRVAEEIFDRPVYADYEVPYFKVRVGGFADRYKAEEYAQRVRAAGYTDAWVVATTMSARQAAPLYDESSPTPGFEDTTAVSDTTNVEEGAGNGG